MRPNAGVVGQRIVPNGQEASGVWDVVEAYEASQADVWPRQLSLNGLVLHLDASDPLSYPGSGYAWYDLTSTVGDVDVRSRNSDWSFTTDSATGLTCLYANANRPSNAGINVPTNTGFNKAAGTIECWVKPVAYDGATGIFANSDGETYTNVSNWMWVGQWADGGNMYFRFGNASNCCNDLIQTNWPTYSPLNVWKCYTFTWNIAGAFSRIYLNGSLVTERLNLPTNIPTTNPTTTGQLFNSHNRTDNEQWRGYCNIYRIYNRALSGTEVLSNFAVYRDRFGV